MSRAFIAQAVVPTPVTRATRRAASARGSRPRTRAMGPDPLFVQKISPFLDALYRYYFRCEVKGMDRVPKGPVLFVGNHNGLLTFEVLMLFYAWWKRFGGTRPVLGLAHTLAMKNPAFRWLIPRLGAVNADRKAAQRAIDQGASLMCYPGGLKEAFRPYRERRRVDFCQHKGFIRLALKTGVPIVPVVSVGAQESYVILNRGDKLAEQLGLKEKFRVAGVPLTFRSLFFMLCVATGAVSFFPWLLAPGAFASIFVPLPAKMSFRFMAPIDIKKWWRPDLDEESNVQRIYDRVVWSMQEVLLEEYSRRKLPIVG